MTNQSKPNIRELAEKAGLSYILLPSSPYIEDGLEKFAKLVAEDCSRQVSNEAGITEHVSGKMNGLINSRLRSAFDRIENRWGLL